MKSRFTYVGIRVKDLEKSIDFYTKILGMQVAGRGRIEQSKGETVGLHTVGDEFILELNHYDEDSPFNTEYTPGEGLDHLAFKVDDLEKALQEAKAAGYPTVLEMKSNESRWVYIEDPNGIWIELFQ
jgi:lactoylglutathione lyase